MCGESNVVDLVLFLNGLPVATVELKTDFTQSIGDAIDQYRFDRHPKPKGPSRRAVALGSKRRVGSFRRQ
jgi:type I restriction enzyme, R subunit